MNATRNHWGMYNFLSSVETNTEVLEDLKHITHEELKNRFLLPLMRKLMKVKLFFLPISQLKFKDVVFNEIPRYTYLIQFILKFINLNNVIKIFIIINIMPILLDNFYKIYYQSYQVVNLVYDYPILFNLTTIIVILILMLCCSLFTKW